VMEKKITAIKRELLTVSIVLCLLIINLGCSPETYAVSTLVSPTNGTIITENPPTFIWISVEDYDVYWLRVAQDSLFTTLVIDISCSADTSYTPDNPFDSGTYSWHMCAIEGGFCEFCQLANSLIPHTKCV